MPRASRIFPHTYVPPSQSLNIILLSEGYTASERSAFLQDCMELVNKLLDMTPFNLSRTWPDWLAIHAVFTPSNNHGPAVDSPPTPGATAYESLLDSTTGRLSLNVARVNAAINTVTLH
jgi:hypothetical protein